LDLGNTPMNGASGRDTPPAKDAVVSPDHRHHTCKEERGMKDSQAGAYP
jgi:hypothetical protein